jgi:hypothetical protein
MAVGKSLAQSPVSGRLAYQKAVLAGSSGPGLGQSRWKDSKLLVACKDSIGPMQVYLSSQTADLETSMYTKVVSGRVGRT